MEDKAQNLRDWVEAALSYGPISWDRLPELDLYMDQVITLMNKELGPFAVSDERLLTPSMINNYVKMDLIPKPVKKRYNREHIAYLLAITLMKQVLTISQVKDGIAFQIAQLGPKGAFDLFCDEQENALQMIATQVLEKQEGRAVLQITVQEGRNHLIRRMCEAVGLEVARLKRTSIGPLKLGMLQPGHWRALKPAELAALRNALNKK